MYTPSGSSIWQPDFRSHFMVDGRFELLDRIGEGATSSVFKVRGKLDRKIYALKVLKESAARHPRLVECFHRELETGRQFDHPNVIRIYGSGEHDGWPYLVMEYINGRTLAELLLMGRLDMKEFERLFRHLLRALAYVHDRGMVHRDVKPVNLMMAEGTTWKLMDFGIAREAGSSATVGSTLGTPDYMSPERLLGGPATAASDIYAAGIVFYEALAGAVPLRYLSAFERCSAIPPPLREARPDVPGWLEQVIARSIATNPDHRFRSVAEILALAGSFEPVAPMAPPPVPEPPPQTPTQTLVPLTQYIGSGPGDPQRALDWLAEVLRALDGLASEGATHEVITPQTVLVDPAGKAHLAEGSASSRDTLVVSSPKYTAPELLKGLKPETAEQHAQKDIYATGFVFYEYLLGETLFQKEFRRVEQGSADLGWMRWQADLGSRATPVAELIPGFLAPLSALLARMMEKDPAKRPHSFDEVRNSVLETVRRTRATQQIAVPSQAKAAPVAAGPAARPATTQGSQSKVMLISGLVTLLVIAITLAAIKYFR